MEYECTQVPAIINIPDNTVKMTIIATLIDENDKLFKAESTLNAADVRAAMIDGDAWESENVKYVLTDKGRGELDG